jgi:hypothetical protein
MDKLSVKLSVTHLTSHIKPVIPILLSKIVQGNIITHFNLN